MSDWNLDVQSPDIPYSFWSFGGYGRGRNKFNIFDATLGIYQTHPLHFKSTKEGLIIEGANSPSKKMLKWEMNNKGRCKNLSAHISACKDSNKTVIEIIYAQQKHSFELKNMEQNKKLQSNAIGRTDLDLIIRKNFKINMIFDVLQLICEYTSCIFNMNDSIDLLKYQDLEESKTPNIIDTTNATRDSYVKLDMANELVNGGSYDKFIVECECKPCFTKRMGLAGIVSLHGTATGWELRLTNRYGTCNFEWVFTTHWTDNWMHNELSVDISKTERESDNWIYLKGEYDFMNGLQLFTVNDKTISRRIKGKPKVEKGRCVEFGRGFGSKDRIYYGLIRNVKIDGLD